MCFREKGKCKYVYKNSSVGKGNFFSIPEGVKHGLKVTSRKPIKVISIQSPEFKGVDRIFIED